MRSLRFPHSILALFVFVTLVFSPHAAGANIADDLLDAIGTSPASAVPIGPGIVIDTSVLDTLIENQGTTTQNLANDLLSEITLSSSLDELIAELKRIGISRVGADAPGTVQSFTFETSEVRDLLRALSGTTTVGSGSVAPTSTLPSTVSATSTLIASLMEQVEALQRQLADLLAEQASSPAVFDLTAEACIFTRTLSYGLNGDDVQTLQQFLINEGFLDADLATGFFGPLTEAAVQAWQAVQGIVSSGSPGETGWGVVGPRTRAAIAGACGAQ